MVKLNALTLLMTAGLLLLSACTWEQGQDEQENMFGGHTASQVTGQQVSPGVPLSFPRDHGAHDQFSIEWWYLTGNVFDAQGQHYAIQWTLFRFAGQETNSPWSDNQTYMAHAKLGAENNQWFEERFARGDVGNAGVMTAPFSAFLDDWQVDIRTNRYVSL